MWAESLSENRYTHIIKEFATRELTEADYTSVIELLSEDAMRGVQLRSLIEDNGFDHPSNRGTYFGYFENKSLVAIALLGTVTMIYARPSAEANALRSFAQTMVEQNINCNLTFGPVSQVEAFGKLLVEAGRTVKMVRRLDSYFCQKTQLPLTSLQMRRANQEEYEAVANAQIEMFVEATGSDPSKADPEGFRRRVSERIDRQRTWVKLHEGEVVFKTELQSVSPEVVYIEGVWTREDHRSEGIGTACLNELVARLLKNHLMVTLMVEAGEEAALQVYRQVGFEFAESYQALYFNPVNA